MISTVYVNPYINIYVTYFSKFEYNLQVSWIELHDTVQLSYRTDSQFK